MVSGATKFMRRHIDHPYLELFFSPRGGNTTELLEKSNWVFAVDNGAFTCLDELKFFTKLYRLVDYRDRCVFVVVPDSFGKSDETRRLFAEWAPVLGDDWPLAFVAQDGQTVSTVPWDDITTLFIGGTTEFKLDPICVRPLIDEARKRSLWVHMGRVNSNKRLTIAYEWGCDSVDGSGYSMFPDAMLPKALAHLARLDDRESVTTAK